MKQVIERVHASIENAGKSYEETEFVVQLALLAMIGDAILGQNVRARMDVPNVDEATTQFRQNLQQLLVNQLNATSTG